MRRFIGLLVLVTLLVGLVAAAGCGKKGGVITYPQGDVKYDSAKNEIQKTENGKTSTWSVQSLSEKALGVPVPSNAKLQSGSAAVISETNGNQKWSGATFWSKDATDSVISWYKEKLSGMTGYKDASANQDGQLIGLFSVRTGETAKSIVIGAGQSGDPGKTEIIITTLAGEGITGAK